MFEIPEGFKAESHVWGVPVEHDALYHRLWEGLVPDQGKCATVNGELLRAAGRVCYDYFNNGWGCNNWSGAVQYILGYFPNRGAELSAALAHVYQLSHGEPVRDDGESYSDADVHAAACFVIMKAVLEFIAAHPTPVPNTVDMFDLQEDDYRHVEDDGDEDEE